RALEALVAVACHRLLADRHQLWRQPGWILRLLLQRRTQRGKQVLTRMRWPTRQDLVQRPAQEVDVRFTTRWLLEHHFWGQIGRGADEGSVVPGEWQTFVRAGLRAHCDAPIHQVDFAELPNHDVLGLDVPMNDAPAV